MHYIILHGTGCTSDDHWFPRLRNELEKQWHIVSIPALPNTEKPDRKTWCDYVRENYVLDSNTVLIWHSAGATVILSILESLEKKIAKAILVSGFFVELDKAWRAKLMLQDTYDRQKIAQHAGKIVLINADNDPRGCDDKQARPVAENIWATFVLAHGMGHMWSGTFNDPCKKLPLILEVIA